MKSPIQFRKCRKCKGSGTEIDDAAVGAEMRKLRASKNITLKAIAHTLGVSASYICDLERGYRNWTETMVERFKRACI